MKTTRTRAWVALASLTLLASACGSDADANADSGVATLEGSSAEQPIESVDTELAADEAALQFSACMRDEGLDFPDIGVDAQGNINIRDAFESAGITPRDESFAEAMESCGEVLESAGFGGGGGRAALTDNPELTDALVEFSDCVREQGFDVGDLTTLGARDPQGGGAGGDAQAERGQGRPEGGLDRNASLANQLGLDIEDPEVEEAFEVCSPILDTIFAEGGLRGGGGPR